jgi:hypothetical protein
MNFQPITQDVFGLSRIGMGLAPKVGNPRPAEQAPPTVDPELLKKLQAQYGRLTGQASNALYGGILGYNPQPMTAEGGQSFAPPQGNLQQPFSNMQGILGQAQRPQFMSQGGGMGDMMQPKLRMY